MTIPEALSSSRPWAGDLRKAAGIVEVLVRCATNSDQLSRIPETSHDSAALSAAPSSPERNPNGDLS